MAQQIDLGYLCGEPKRKRKVRKQSSTKGNNQGKPAKIISYCPECPIKDMANPEASEHVPARPPRRTGRCRAGHTWAIGGQAHT